MKLITTMLLFICTTFLWGQKYVTVDVGKRNTKETAIGLDYSGVQVINLCPSRAYKFKLKVEESKDDGPTETASDNGLKGKYERYNTAYDALKNCSTESVIKQKISDLETAFKDITKASKDTLKLLQEMKDILIAKTRDTINFDFPLRKNQLLRFWVYRMDGENEIKSWYNSFSTPSGINFVTHFGFTYGLNSFNSPDNFYTMDVSSPGNESDSFKVTKLNSNGSEFLKDLSITANFLFPLKNKKNKNESDVKFAWLAGFGIGGDTRFSVFTGPALMLQDFVALGFAVGMTNTYKLNGTYKEGQIIKENLNFDQLHVMGIRPDIMVTLSLRLSKKQMSGAEEIVN